MDTAIRFVLNDDTIVNFLLDEIIRLDIKTIQANDIYKNEDNDNRQLFLGKSYKKFEVTFNIKTTSVFDNITTLYNETDSDGDPDWMYMYYKYNIDTTLVKVVQMKRDRTIEEYSGGLLIYRPLRIDFYETKPVGVAVVLPHKIGI